ncbi:MAG: ATP-dependent sacrificial sulfur transferase LarE [Candidatus Thorarchaeota archaeon]|nr:ATP-dependent sacrificial sulfur transferase LarE [Candidatus Thorarchaeota archaeon]
MNDTTKAKFNKVREILQGKKVLVAVSGGVDSSVLASIAAESAQEAVFLTVDSSIVTAPDRKNLENFAEILGTEPVTIEFDWIAHENLANNPPERCYNCKRKLASLWREEAKSRGLDMVIEGTNASDLDKHRPGIKALKEFGIRSPLAEGGITKREIREYAAAHNLPAADSPSSTCLATRFPSGTEITQERLEKIEAAEGIIRHLFDVQCVRARYHGDLVRIEVGHGERENLFDSAKLDVLHRKLKNLGFEYITMDAYGYQSGSMA